MNSLDLDELEDQNDKINQDPSDVINEFNIELEVGKHGDPNDKGIKNESDPFNKVKKFENLAYKDTKIQKDVSAVVEGPQFMAPSDMVNLHNSEGSGESGKQFLGYAVQRMPTGLAKELKLNSSGSAGGENASGGNGSGGVTGIGNLAHMGGMNSGSMGTGGS